MKKDDILKRVDSIPHISVASSSSIHGGTTMSTNPLFVEMTSTSSSPSSPTAAGKLQRHQYQKATPSPSKRKELIGGTGSGSP